MMEQHSTTNKPYDTITISLFIVNKLGKIVHSSVLLVNCIFFLSFSWKSFCLENTQQKQKWTTRHCFRLATECMLCVVEKSWQYRSIHPQHWSSVCNAMCVCIVYVFGHVCVWVRVPECLCTTTIYVSIFVCLSLSLALSSLTLT